MSIFRAMKSGLMGSTTLNRMELTKSLSSDTLAVELTRNYGVSGEFAKVAALIIQERKDAALDILAHRGNVLPIKAIDNHLAVPANDNNAPLQKAA